MLIIEMTGGNKAMDDLIAAELVDGLKAIFNDKLLSVILYGSVARGIETNDSDIDIAIILKMPRNSLHGKN